MHTHGSVFLKLDVIVWSYFANCRVAENVPGDLMWRHCCFFVGVVSSGHASEKPVDFRRVRLSFEGRAILLVFSYFFSSLLRIKTDSS